jgi:uncharacterized lipoprotein YddW (UPF0748 family)
MAGGTPGDQDAGPDGGDAGDAGVGSDGGPSEDAGAPDAGPALVPVAHARELRGVWVATVFNLDMASGLTPTTGVMAVRDLVVRTRAAGLNAIFFQVRPESDAWYDSTLEPWSRFLSGTQGTAPGWDPLATLLTEAHARGVEVHAWLNPYRAATNPVLPTATNHVTATLAAHVITYNDDETMDPGAEAVRAHVLSVVEDLLDRYDVDGLHFDDYFYPYPDPSNSPFPDLATFQAYQADGGTLSRSDWRRANVNQLVREVMALVRTQHPHVRFGISPFGIWRPGTPPGIVGLDAYEVLACDAVAWLTEGSVDYVAPQLYWPTTSTGQPFGTLAAWWASQSNGRHVFAGHGIYRLGQPGWDVNELRSQVTVARSHRASGLLGGLHYRDTMLRQNVGGITTLFRDELYLAPAIPPPVPRPLASITPAPPTLVRQGTSLVVGHPAAATVRALLLYRLEPGGWSLSSVEGAPPRTVGPLMPGTWAVSAVARGGAESLGAVMTVP